MNLLKPVVTIILLIGIGVHIYSLAVTPYPFPDEPNWSHYAHLVAYIIALYAVLKLQTQSIGKILYALAIIYPFYFHARLLLVELQGVVNIQNVVACVAVVVFLPLGIWLFRK